MASAAGNRKAAAGALEDAKKMIQAPPIELVGVAPHSALNRANVATPMITMRRWPITSATRPPSANSADSDSR